MAKPWQRVTVLLLPRVRAVALLALAVAVLLAALGATGADGPVALRVATLGSLGVLLVWWAWFCGRDRLPLVGLPLEIAATSLAMIVVDGPLHALSIVVLAVKFRSLYPGWRRAVAFAGGVVAGTAAGTVLLAPVLPGVTGIPDSAVLLISVPTVLVITQIVTVAISQRDVYVARERQLAETAVAIAGTVDRGEIATIAATAAISMMPTRTGASAHLAPAGYGDPDPAEGLALAVPGRTANAAFLVVRVTGGVSTDARHALTVLAETVGQGLSNADTFDVLRSRAECDPLTGLPNRPALTGHLRLAVDNARAREQLRRGPARLWLIMIDLDGFRHVNSDFGHEAGDRVLVMIADRIRRCVRENDIVARLGGDEFGVLVRTDDVDDRGEQVADRIHAALLEPIKLPLGGAVHTSGSLGIGRWQPGMSGDDLLDLAGEAMYRAKPAA